LYYNDINLLNRDKKYVLVEMSSKRSIACNFPKALYRADEYIWAGAYLGAPTQSEAIAKLQWAVHEQIAVVIDLTTPADRLEPYAELLAMYAPHITHYSFPIQDVNIPSHLNCWLSLIRLAKPWLPDNASMCIVGVGIRRYRCGRRMLVYP
jgi:hypothetical protein